MSQDVNMEFWLRHESGRYQKPKWVMRQATMQKFQRRCLRTDLMGLNPPFVPQRYKELETDLWREFLKTAALWNSDVLYFYLWKEWKSFMLTQRKRLHGAHLERLLCVPGSSRSKGQRLSWRAAEGWGKAEEAEEESAYTPECALVK